MASTAISSCSDRLVRLAIGVTNSFPEIVQRSELKLLDRALAAAEHARDLRDTLLLGKSHRDHAPLVVGEFIDHLKQPRAMLELLGRRLGLRVVRMLAARANGMRRAIGDRVGGNPVEPCREWHTAPLVAAEILERAMKNVGGQILGFRALVNPPRDVRIDARKIFFVQTGEAARIGLRGRDHPPLFRIVRQNCRPNPRHVVTYSYKRPPQQKVTP